MNLRSFEDPRPFFGRWSGKSHLLRQLRLAREVEAGRLTLEQALHRLRNPRTISARFPCMARLLAVVLLEAAVVDRMMQPAWGKKP